MDSKTKAKILKQIKSGEVLAFSGRKVKIIAIVGNQVRCKKMNLTRECFGHLTVDYNRLEPIIKNPYSHKHPAAFLKRKGFSPICSDEGRPLFEGTVDGSRVIIGYSSPATASSCDISVGVQTKDGGTAFSLTMNPITDFHQALVHAKSLVKSVTTHYKKKPKKKKK